MIVVRVTRYLVGSLGEASASTTARNTATKLAEPLTAVTCKQAVTLVRAISQPHTDTHHTRARARARALHA